ncbi:MAG: transcriptional activator NhaR [Nitrospirales bacterium]|nr:transcriptional activator NhaR [Nitrospirales bacterium]
MEWLNYHHLLYFWVIAREGSIKRACEELHLSQPALSAQLRALEEKLGEKLFHRVGRTLVLTDVGQMAYRYSQEIFSLGQEFTNLIKGRPSQRPVKLVVGIAEVVPKMVAYKLLKSAFAPSDSLQIVCWEGRLERLLGELALHTLDIVLADTAIPSTVRILGHSHLLGESGVSLFASSKLATKHRKNFPKSLEGAPFLLPTGNAMLRRGMDEWFSRKGITPRVVGEFEDGATMKAFGQAGKGIFPGSTVVDKEISRQYLVKKVGDVPDVREQFYALSVERRLKHPGVLAIVDSAHKTIFRASKSP